MLKHLRAIPEAELNKKLTALRSERFKFAYRHKLSSTATATSVIMTDMCTKYNAKSAGAEPEKAPPAAVVTDDEEEDEEE